MKLPDSPTRQRTRRAILEAVAQVITETNGLGFSVQAVANRAGVSHRTVYNHFPTRDALCEAFSDYVDESLMTVTEFAEPVLSLEGLPATTARLYQILQLRERNVRAGVILMIASRRPPKAWQQRSQTIEQIIASAATASAVSSSAPPPRQAAAAVRLFLSSMGWHLLTELCGLSTDEASATSAWAGRVLLDAATSAGKAPSIPRKKGARNASQRRRR